MLLTLRLVCVFGVVVNGVRVGYVFDGGVSVVVVVCSVRLLLQLFLVLPVSFFVGVCCCCGCCRVVSVGVFVIIVGGCCCN